MRYISCLLLACCAPLDPSDDPADYDVDASIDYTATVSEPRFVAPSSALPVLTNASNNNVAIHFFQGRLWLAWRTAPTHFASADAEMHIISSDDDGVTWRHEHSISLGSDVREPQLYDSDGRLLFTFFQAGTNQFAFEPQAMWRTERNDDGAWSALEQWGEEGEVPWDLKKRGGAWLLTSYTGNHYESGPSDVRVHFQTSRDGVTWSDVGERDVYVGGASEAGFELDEDGAVWAVLRNEDGDDTGFGSLLCKGGGGRSPGPTRADWQCPSESDPERYDSPKMFRHGDDLFLVARRDVGGPFDQGDDALDITERRQRYAAAYWDRPKRTALYRINREAMRVEHVLDLPSAGDTAFPSVRRTGAHTFLIANYTSPLDDPDRTWLEGQGAPDGTGIYLIELAFVP